MKTHHLNAEIEGVHPLGAWKLIIWMQKLKVCTHWVHEKSSDDLQKLKVCTHWVHENLPVVSKQSML